MKIRERESVPQARLLTPNVGEQRMVPTILNRLGRNAHYLAKPGRINPTGGDHEKGGQDFPQLLHWKKIEEPARQSRLQKNEAVDPEEEGEKEATRDGANGGERSCRRSADSRGGGVLQEKSFTALNQVLSSRTTEDTKVEGTPAIVRRNPSYLGNELRGAPKNQMHNGKEGAIGRKPKKKENFDFRDKEKRENRST